jgi:hypothetical protein
VERPAAAAAASAVICALETIRMVQSAGARTDVGKRYRAFFVRFTQQLHVSSDQAQRALTLLGLLRKDDAGGSASCILTLRDGTSTILQLPRGSGRITLTNLARQLHENPIDLVLLLTGLINARSSVFVRNDSDK